MNPIELNNYVVKFANGGKLRVTYPNESAAKQNVRKSHPNWDIETIEKTGEVDFK